MIELNIFLKALKNENVNFVTGVPDSLLKDICGFMSDNLPPEQHIIATNEGSAIGLAIGNYLATKFVPLVYLQNSGLGNIINPLVSLADPSVYGIPMLLMIGWRGEINENKQINDEPQHKKQGKITLDQLELLNIPYVILNKDSQNINQIINKCVRSSRSRQGPVAIVVKKNSFQKYKNFYSKSKKQIDLPSRKKVLEIIVKNIPRSFPIVSTTGVASRELYEIRTELGIKDQSDFLTIGGMGHASQIASGIAIANIKRKIFCIDGDGSALMHMGAFAINSEQNNLIHILINNGVHDSVGAQPTQGQKLNFSEIAKVFGYKYSYKVKNIDEVSKLLNKIINNDGSTFVEIICKPGFSNNLGRPSKNLEKSKIDFMYFLSK
tara:strand:+ start:3178 stop:4317 length:1140 start_codon:yes stop_codon:yes gene_type:complete